MTKAGEGEQQAPRRRHRLAKGIAFVVLLALAAAGWTYALGRYRLGPGEQALVSRLGGPVAIVSEPGEHWRWPTPLGHAVIVRPPGQQVLDLGTASSPQDEAGSAPTVVTRDENLIRLPASLSYRVRDPVAERYRVADAAGLLRGVTLAVLRRVAAVRSLEQLRTDPSAELAEEARAHIQRILQACSCGIEVTSLSVAPPEPLVATRAAFEAATLAADARDREVSAATRERERKLAEAQADAVRQLEVARAQHDARIAEATGEAESFRALAAEYRKQPELMRTRLFLETMEAVLPAARVFVMEPGVQLPTVSAPPSSPAPAAPGPSESSRP